MLGILYWNYCVFYKLGLEGLYECLGRLGSFLLVLWLHGGYI
jgi:hypothetical protein